MKTHSETDSLSDDFRRIVATKSTIAEGARESLREFVEQILSIQQENLVTIILFGGLVRDASVMPDWSDIDLLLIYRALDTKIMRELARASARVELRHHVRIDATVLLTSELSDLVLSAAVVDGASINALLWPGRVSVVLFGKVPPFSFTKAQIEEVQIRYMSSTLSACRDYQLTTLFRSADEAHLKSCVPRIARWTFSVVRSSLRLFDVWAHPYDESIVAVERLFPQIDTQPLWALVRARRSFSTFLFRDNPTIIDNAIAFMESYVPFALHHFRQKEWSPQQ